MRFSSILLATDFSPSADHAADVALALAQAVGGTIEMVHAFIAPVVVGPDGGAFAADTDDLTAATESAQAALLEARRQLEARAGGVPIRSQALLGPAVEELLRLAASGRYDILIMGSHGRTGMRRLLLGSVTEAVTRRSPIPVLAVRLPEEARVAETDALH
jgi:nucleotide-binding universal stress UspA family protein